MSKITMCLENGYRGKVLASFDLDEFADKVRADTINKCAEKFAEILSNMTNICVTNCPIKCNWGTDDTCKNMCKKWFIEQLKENKE